MVTKQEALDHDTFHYGTCTQHIGPRGGITHRIIAVRRSGQTKVWKRDTERFRIPIKYGLYQSSYITNLNAADFHTADSCPKHHLIIIDHFHTSPS